METEEWADDFIASVSKWIWSWKVYQYREADWKTKDDVLERIDGWHEEENDPTLYMLSGNSRLLQRIWRASWIDVRKNRSTVYDVVKNYVTEKIGKFTGAEVIACPIGSRSAVLNALNKLTKEEIIVKCGSGRGTFYVRKYFLKKWEPSQ